MKNLFIMTVALFVFSASAQVKVGVVNIQKIITTVKMGKNVMKTLEKSFNAKKKTLKKDEESIKKMQKDFQKQNLVLSDKAKAKKEAAIRQKIAGIQQQTMKFQKEIQKQELELKKPILEKLKGVIDDVSKDEKLDLTFEVSSSPIVYAKSKVDITEKVIKAFDKKFN